MGGCFSTFSGNRMDWQLDIPTRCINIRYVKTSIVTFFFLFTVLDFAYWLHTTGPMHVLLVSNTVWTDSIPYMTLDDTDNNNALFLTSSFQGSQAPNFTVFNSLLGTIRNIVFGMRSTEFDAEPSCQLHHHDKRTIQRYEATGFCI